MNVSFWINLALACVSPPIGKSQAGTYRLLGRGQSDSALPR
jgi:hypothetical protein